MKQIFISLPALLVSVAKLLAVEGKSRSQVPLPNSHTTRQIEGWSIRVDDRLLSGDGAARRASPETTGGTTVPY